MGKPEYVVNFMRFIAEELREYMARLGVRTIDELIGRKDLLKKRADLSEREQQIDVSAILDHHLDESSIRYDEKDPYDFKLSDTLDEKVIIKGFKKAFREGKAAQIEIDVRNTDRSLGTAFGSEITNSKATATTISARAYREAS